MRNLAWLRGRPALVSLVVVASLAAACGTETTVTETAASQQSVDPSQTPASEDDATAVPSAAPAPTAPAPAPDDGADEDPTDGGCVLAASAVGAAVGAEIVDRGLWTSANTSTGLAAGGCSYETADGTRYVIGVATPLEDPQASASPIFDDRLARGSAAAELATLADGAFLSGESVFISTGGATFVVEVVGASLEADDFDLLRQLAESLLALGGFDARCSALPTLISSEWQPGVDVLRGGGAVDYPTGGFSYDLCEVQIAAVPGARVSLRSSDDPGWFAAEREGASDEVTVVEGLGAEVLSLDEDLLVRLGDRVLVVNGQNAAGDPLDPTSTGPLHELARAVIAAG